MEELAEERHLRDGSPTPATPSPPHPSHAPRGGEGVSDTNVAEVQSVQVEHDNPKALIHHTATHVHIKPYG